jgi:hypothetical protein
MTYALPWRDSTAELSPFFSIHEFAHYESTSFILKYIFIYINNSISFVSLLQQGDSQWFE